MTVIDSRLAIDSQAAIRSCIHNPFISRNSLQAPQRNHTTSPAQRSTKRPQRLLPPTTPAPLPLIKPDIKPFKLTLRDPPQHHVPPHRDLRMQPHRTRIIKQRLQHKQAPMTHSLHMLRLQRRSVRAYHDHRRRRIDPGEPDEAPRARRVDAHVQERGLWVVCHARGGVGLVRVGGATTYHAQRKFGPLGDRRDWRAAGGVGGADVEGFEFRTAESLVAGAVDADGGDLDVWCERSGSRVADVGGGEGTKLVDNVAEIEHVHVEVLRGAGDWGSHLDGDCWAAPRLRCPATRQVGDATVQRGSAGGRPFEVVQLEFVARPTPGAQYIACDGESGP